MIKATAVPQYLVDEMIAKIAYYENIFTTPYLASGYREEELDDLAEHAYQLREVLAGMGVEA